MTAQALISIPFHGKPLITFQHNGEAHAAMKPIAEGMGLDWKSQHARIKRNPILSEGMVIMTIPSDGGPQDMVAFPLRLLNGWLFGIDVDRVKPELRDTILTYQRECYDALYRYWHQGAAVNPREVDLPFDEMPEQNPFDRLSVARMRELRKSGNSVLFQSYLISKGVTPDYIAGLLQQGGIPALSAAPAVGAAAPLDHIAREVPLHFDQEDGTHWYLLRETFARICGDYDATATARMLVAKRYMPRYSEGLMVKRRFEVDGKLVRSRYYAVSKRLAQEVGHV